MVLACVASGYSPWQARPWTWSDSALYLQIAQHGYTLFQCAPHWCGNSGWFPAYPWLVGALHLTGLPLVATAVGVSWFFHAATLVLLWFTFLGRRLDRGSVAVLLYAAFAPGLFYHESIYPLSLFAFFTLLHLWFLWRGRLWSAAAAGAIAVLAYPVGVVIPISAAIWLIFQPGRALERVRRVAIVAGGSALGLVTLAVDQRLEVGHWNAYLLVQDKYHHGLQQPFTPLWAAIQVLGHHAPFTLTTASATQTVIFTAVFGCVLVAVASRRPRSPLDLLIALWLLGSWLAPDLQSHVQVYRIEASLLPLALLIRRLPTPLAAVFVVLVIEVAVELAQMAFEGRLV
jgi:hypothetical protein